MRSAGPNWRPISRRGDAHPEATLTELETAIDTRLQALRADVLGGLATDLPEQAGSCPRCGGTVVARGTRVRRVVTRGDQPIAPTRPYQTCPACTGGCFPPW